MSQPCQPTIEDWMKMEHPLLPSWPITQQERDGIIEQVQKYGLNELEAWDEKRLRLGFLKTDGSRSLIKITGTRPDALGRQSFSIYWLANYHPGHPEGEYRWAIRGQNFFAKVSDYSES